MKVSTAYTQNQKNIQPNQVVDQKLLISLEKFARTLHRYGFDVETVSPSSLRRLADIDTEKKEQIAAFFERWTAWIQPAAETPYLVTYDTEREKSFLTQALEYYRLYLDEDFIKTIQKDDLIEIYGEDMIQMYRSLNFFKFCGYSLLDISINEWYVLWERPKRVLESMHQEVIGAFQNAVTCKKLNIPKHVNREIYKNTELENFVPSAYLVEFQNIGILKTHPLHPKGAAFVCTSKAEILAKGEEAYSIQFV